MDYLDFGNIFVDGSISVTKHSETTVYKLGVTKDKVINFAELGISFLEDGTAIISKTGRGYGPITIFENNYYVMRHFFESNMHNRELIIDDIPIENGTLHRMHIVGEVSEMPGRHICAMNTFEKHKDGTYKTEGIHIYFCDENLNKIDY